MTQARAQQKLRAAHTEIRRLRAAADRCTCVPMTAAQRERKIEQLCAMISKFSIDDFDEDKLRARAKQRAKQRAELQKTQSTEGVETSSCLDGASNNPGFS